MVGGASNQQDKDSSSGPTPGHPRVFRRRWFMLAIFIGLSMSNAFQWMEYSIIANIVMDFYGVPSIAVDWTSMIYMLAYIPLIFPAAWTLDKYGLRLVALLGAFGNCMGAWVKCASASPNLFALSFTGQAIVGTSQIFILNLPPRLAAVWFGPNEVSTACALGVFGNQLGIAFGFLVPPMLVPWPATKQAVAQGFTHLFFMSAAINSIIFVLVLLYFKDSPPVAPSPAQMSAIEATMEKDFFGSLKKLVFNPNFCLLFVTYGLNVGAFYAVSTLLNQMLLNYYPTEGINIGRIGLLIVLAGMVGSILTGIILDRTKMFKRTTFVVYCLSFVGMVIYTFTIDKRHLWLVFVVAGLLGFFMTGYLPLGFELGVEITYPVSEGTVSGLLNASCQFFGFIETLLIGVIMKKISTLACNLSMCAILFVGAGLTLFIKSDLRRQNAGKTAPIQEVPMVPLRSLTQSESKTPMINSNADNNYAGDDDVV